MTAPTPPPGHSCPLCPRPRDVHRSRVYRAQHRPEVPEGPALDLDACRALVSGVVASEWWLERFGFRHEPHVSTYRGGRRKVGAWDSGGDCQRATGEIRLTPACRRPLYIAHELAHIAQPNGTADHGVEFCTCFLALVRRIMGSGAASALASAFDAERVPYVRPEGLEDAA